MACCSGMTTGAEDSGTLTLCRTARVGTATVVFGVFVLLVLAVVGMVVGSVLSPATQSFDCTRATGRCELTSSWWHGRTRSFPLAQLADLELVGSEHHPAIGTRGNQHWTNEARDREAAADYRRAVKALHAFSHGGAPALHVEIPSSHRRVITSLAIGVLIIGVPAFLLPAMISDRRTRLLLDRNSGQAVVERRGFFGKRAERTVPLEAIKEIRTYNARQAGGYWTRLYLEPGRVLAHSELTNPQARAEISEWGDRAAAFLGVPHRDRKA